MSTIEPEKVPELQSNLPWSEQFRIIAKRYVDADAAATLLEESKSATLSQMMLRLTDTISSVSGRETYVKASDEWHEYIETMIVARKNANLLKFQLEYIRMKHWENNNHDANKRAETRL